MVNIRKNYLNGTPKTKTELYGPDTTNKHVYTFDTGDRINFDRKLSANGYEWISQPRSGGGFWYIPIRELKNSTYWGEIGKR